MKRVMAGVIAAALLFSLWVADAQEVRAEPAGISYVQLDMSAVFNSDAYTGGQAYMYDLSCYYPVNPGSTYNDPLYGAVPMDMRTVGSNNVWLSSGWDRTTLFPTSFTLDTDIAGATNIWIVGMDGGWVGLGSQVDIRYTLDGIEYVSSFFPNDWAYGGTGPDLQLWVNQQGIGGDIAVARIDLPQAGTLTKISVIDLWEFTGASIPVFAITVGKADNTPPVTTASLSGITGNNGWYISDVNITLTADDNPGGSGVARTEYSFDGISWNTYTAPFSVTAEGATILYYRSIDNAGNIETLTESVSYSQLDMSSIFNSDAYTGGQAYMYDTGCYYLTYPGSTYNDPLYGAVPMDMRTAGTDNVWLSSGWDRTTPFPTGFTLDADIAGVTNIWVVGLDGGWVNGGTQVDIRYTLDGTEYVSSYIPNDWCWGGTGPGLELWVSGSYTDIAVARIDLPQAGTLTQISVTDTSGVEGSSIPVFAVTVGEKVNTYKSVAIKIDKTLPVVTIDSPQARTYLTSENLNISFSVADSLSGVADTAATLDGNPIASGDTLSLADKAGNHIFVVSASDEAGNTVTSSVNFSVLMVSIIDIDPNTLNIKSRSEKNAVTAYIELPEGYNVAQIDVSSVEMSINGSKIAVAQLTPTSVGDYDKDGVMERMVKFNRQTIINALGSTTGDIVLTVSGRMNDGSTFSGMDTIRVINPGK